MHAVYLTARHKMLNQVTFDEMRQRDIDIVIPSPLLEVRGEIGISSNLCTLRAVLRKLWYPRIIVTDVQEPALLEMNKCKALLRVEEILRWGDDKPTMWRLPDEEFFSEFDACLEKIMIWDDDDFVMSRLLEENFFSESTDCDYSPTNDLGNRHHLILVDESEG